MKTSLTIPLAIALGGVIIAGAVYLTVSQQEISTGSNTGNPSLVRPVDSSDHILGNPAAPIVIVEYSDFDCSYCKTFQATLHRLIADEGAAGQVAWVYRNYPLVALHPNAVKHAEAAECVAKVSGNDAYWKFADELFAGQPTDPTQYGALAVTAGVLPDAFANCYQSASSTIGARIDADIENGKAIGAAGTPYSLLLAPDRAPVVIPGAYSYDDLKQMVEAALAQLQ